MKIQEPGHSRNNRVEIGTRKSKHDNRDQVAGPVDFHGTPMRAQEDGDHSEPVVWDTALSPKSKSPFSSSQVTGMEK